VLKRLSVTFTSVTLVLLSAAVLVQSSGKTPIYQDPTQPFRARVDDLMSRMTLKEKVGQLNMPCVYVDKLGKDIPRKPWPRSSMWPRVLQACLLLACSWDPSA
jgi:hypothetical protein